MVGGHHPSWHGTIVPERLPQLVEGAAAQGTLYQCLALSGQRGVQTTLLQAVGVRAGYSTGPARLGGTGAGTVPLAGAAHSSEGGGQLGQVSVCPQTHPLAWGKVQEIFQQEAHRG